MLLKMKPRRLPTFGDVLLALGIIVPLWVLVMVFLLYIPSISDISVHKLDKPILPAVRSLAQNTAIASSLSASILTLCSCLFLTRARRRKASSEKE